MYRVTNISRAPRPFKGVKIFPGEANSVLFEDKEIDAFNFKVFGFRIEKESEKAVSATRPSPKPIVTPTPVKKEEVPKKMKEWVEEEEEKEKEEEKEETLDIGAKPEGTIDITIPTEEGTEDKEEIEKPAKTTKKRATKKKKSKRKKKS